MPDRQPHRLGYQPALDGLRGVAVAAVLCFHSSMPWMRGGELGVDLFFVLSGFLITTLLIEEHVATGSISLRSFWARRVRRLFPALVLVLLGVAAYAAFVADPSQLGSIRLDALASLTYWSNWRFIFSHQSYFAQFGAPSPLRHVWSLSVEEQWYLVWPFAMIVMLRLVRDRLERLLPLLIGLTLTSVAIMSIVSASPTGIDRAYYGTDSRAQTLLIGATLAVVLARWPIRRRQARAAVQAVGLGGAAFCGWAMVTQRGDSHWMLNGGYALFALCGAAVVAAAMMPRTGLLKSLLRAQPLVWLGRISYGLYLWHWPVNVWLDPDRVHLSQWPLFGLRTVVAVAISALSYVLIEQPIRRRRVSFARPRLALAGAAASAAAVVVVATTMGTGGSRLEASSLTSGHAPRTTLPANLTVPSTTVAQTPIPPVPANRPARVLIVGDSTGWTLGWEIQDRYRPGITLDNAAVIGCGLLPDARAVIDGRIDEPQLRGECMKQDERWVYALERDEPDIVVMAFGAWEVYDQDRADGTRLKVGTAKWHAALLRQFRHDIDFLNRYAHSRIVLLDVPCYQERERRLGGTTSARNDPKRVRAVQRVFDEMARRHADQVTTLPISQWFCPGGKYLERRDGVVLRPDGVHTDIAGASLTWQDWLTPRLLQVARTPEEAPVEPGPSGATPGQTAVASGPP